jgi:hypothetical protein
MLLMILGCRGVISRIRSIKSVAAYEEFLRSEPPRRSKDHDPGTGLSAAQREDFKKKLETFIGVNGQYSVIGTSDARRASTVPVPRGEREEVGARHDPTTSVGQTQCARPGSPTVCSI